MQSDVLEVRRQVGGGEDPRRFARTPAEGFWRQPLDGGVSVDCSLRPTESGSAARFSAGASASRLLTTCVGLKLPQRAADTAPGMNFSLSGSIARPFLRNR
jgi:hypothetical protein